MPIPPPLQLLHKLTTPALGITTAEHRHKARLLAYLSLALLLAIGIIAPIWVVSTPDFTAAPYLSLGTLISLGLAYALSRTTHYTAGALVIILAIIGLVWGALLTIPSHLEQGLVALNFLVLAVMVASLFLRRRFTMLVVGVIFLTITGFFFVPAVPSIVVFAYLAFFVLVTLLGLISNVLNQHYQTRLVESEALYRSLVAALSEGVVWQAKDGAIKASNAAAEEILGLTADQMMGRTSIDPRWYAIHEDGSPFPGETHPAMVTLRTGEPQHNVVMGVHNPNDQWRWISINTHPLILPYEREPYAVVASFTDITNLKTTAQRLREKHDELDRFFDVVHDLLSISNLDGQFIRVNQAWERELGYCATELLNQPFLNFIHPDDQQATTQAMAMMTEGKAVHHFVNRYQLRNGSYRAIEWNANRLGDRIYAAARDVTEQLAAEEALRHSEARYRSMFENNQAVKLLINPQTGQIVDANTAASRFYGYTQDQLRTMRIQDINILSDEEIRAEMNRAKVELRHVFHFRHRLASGEIRDVEVFSGPVPIQNQTLLYSIILDVTPVRQAQQRAFELALEQERAQLLATFIQNASHEFRTPLAVIGTNAFLMARLDTAEKRQAKLAIINEQIKRMVKLIDMQLIMSKLKSTAATDMPHIELGVDMEVIIGKVSYELSSLYGPHPTLEIDCPPHLPHICGNPEDLQEALKQLLDNAYRFTTAEGHITLRAGANEQELWIEIQDTGLGIPPANIPKLFQLFWREDGAHSTPGFGLGLPIAHRIVELHGGELTITSTAGVGTAVTMHLPRRQCATPHHKPSH